MFVSSPQGGTVQVDDITLDTFPITVKSYPPGTSVKLRAIPAKGYEFTGWSGSLTSQENPVTIQMDSGKDITANFSLRMHSLTIKVNGAGFVTPSVGDHSYTYGTVVDISATSDSGYKFDGWTGEVVDAKLASTTVTIDSDKTIIANFSRITHMLTIEVNGAGSVNPSVGNHTYTDGTVLNISATPDTGHQFDGWTGEVADASLASTTVIIDSDKTIIANFSKAQPTTLLLGAIIAGGIAAISGVVWLVARRRRARA